VGNHLFVIFAVLDVSFAVNSCLNRSFFRFIRGNDNSRSVVWWSHTHNCKKSMKLITVITVNLCSALKKNPNPLKLKICTDCLDQCLSYQDGMHSSSVLTCKWIGFSPILQILMGFLLAFNLHVNN